MQDRLNHKFPCDKCQEVIEKTRNTCMLESYDSNARLIIEIGELECTDYYIVNYSEDTKMVILVCIKHNGGQTVNLYNIEDLYEICLNDSSKIYYEVKEEYIDWFENYMFCI